MGKQARQAILPFFIPMQGCAYRCVYCDQRSISGYEDAPNPQEVADAALAYNGHKPAQLAFYGGSFTALPWQRQEAYLQAVQPALQAGIIDSVRVSTRPDALDADLLKRLAAFGVTTVELGIQSFDGDVLALAGRAYSPAKAVAACKLVKEVGLQLGIQLMTGLPGDSRNKSLASMRQACGLRPEFMRLYPTVVLRHTPLAELYSSGEYQPQSIGEAVRLCGDMLALAEEQGITVIRMGLNPSPSLEEALLAGPYHPAFGQMARVALKLQQAHMLLSRLENPVVLRFPPAERPLLFGQKNSGWVELTQAYAGLSAEPAPELAAGSLEGLDSAGNSLTLGREDFLAGFCVGLR